MRVLIVRGDSREREQRERAERAAFWFPINSESLTITNGSQ